MSDQTKILWGRGLLFHDYLICEEGIVRVTFFSFTLLVLLYFVTWITFGFLAWKGSLVNPKASQPLYGTIIGANFFSTTILFFVACGIVALRRRRLSARPVEVSRLERANVMKWPEISGVKLNRRVFSIWTDRRKLGGLVPDYRFWVSKSDVPLVEQLIRERWVRETGVE